VGGQFRSFQALAQSLHCFVQRNRFLEEAMFKLISRLLIAASVLVMGGCSSTPSTNIKQPLTAKPVATQSVMINDGAIFQPGQGVILFEDRRPRRIGDTLTVNLVENIQITRKLDNKQNRIGNATVNIPSPFILGQARGIGATTFAPSSTANNEAKTDVTDNNKVTGNITVTVVDVLANGNLAVSGEKQVSLDKDTQFIRLAGVVNPSDIGQDGTIDSTKIADAKFESKGSTGLDPSSLTSLMARFFLDVLPF
jgi:flagellar L-ring protein precursor FlgH